MWMRLFMCLAWLLQGSCSLLLQWDHEGLACVQDANTSSYTCLRGYSCVVQDNLCVGGSSRGPQASCYEPAQCRAGLVCPAGGDSLDAASLAVGFRCLSPCAGGDPSTPSTQIYEASACGAGEICYPFPSRTAGRIDSACDDGDNCAQDQVCSSVRAGSGGICISMSPTARSCLPSCTISAVNDTTKTPAGSYKDNCGGASGAFCQLLGLPGKKHMTCQKAGSLTPLKLNDACANAIANPCPTGSGCINQICRSYCLTVASSTPKQSTCAINEQCCGIDYGPGEPLQNTTVGYCSPAANKAGVVQACQAF